MPIETFDATKLSGIGFLDMASKRTMRYLYPDCGHWAAGWIVAQNSDGGWYTFRKATDDDISRLNRAVSVAHHRGEVCR